jgi:phosphopantetheinyl transferase
MKTIFKKIKNNSFTLAIDVIDTKLNHHLKPPENLKNENKIIEWVNSRQLIKNIWPDLILSYNKYGAPQTQKEAISISHTKKYVSVIVSEKKASIDIEKIQSKILKISPKFMNDMELIKFSSEINATICWCAKECMFKLFQKGKIDFKKDLKVKSIEKDLVTCSLFNQNLQLNYKIFDNHVLVYYYD